MSDNSAREQDTSCVPRPHVGYSFAQGRDRAPRNSAFAAAVLAALLSITWLIQPASAQLLSREQQAPIIFKKDVVAEQTVAATAALFNKTNSRGSIRVRIGMRIGAVVGTRDDLSDAAIAGLDRAQDALATRVTGHSTAAAVRKFRSMPYMSMNVTAEQLARLVGDPDVEWVRETTTFSPSLEYSRSLIRADTLIASKRVDGSGFAVAVIDTGVDTNHAMLAGKIEADAAACFSGNFPGGAAMSLCPSRRTTEFGAGAAVPCKQSLCWHGTHVASIAVGNGATLKGVARGSRIIPIMAMHNNKGNVRFDDDDLFAALTYIYNIRDRYKIAAVNLSVQGSLFYSACDATFPDYAGIFMLLRRAGIAPVVSAGNMGADDAVAAPACVSNAISVGATSKADVISDFSNLNKNVTLLAPGEAIHAALPQARYGYSSGTSMAAPHVAGALAVLKQEFPTSTTDELVNALACGGKQVARSGNGISKPRINLLGAADALSHTSSVRQWGFGASKESADWTTVRGNWAVRNGTYSGRPAGAPFIGAMLSTCANSVILTARLRLTSAAPATDPGRAGIVIAPRIDHVRNTLSGYWLTYSNVARSTVSVLKLDRISLDGRKLGTVVELCKKTGVPIVMNGFNAINAEISGAVLGFALNGRPVCRINTGSKLLGSAMLAAQFLGANQNHILTVDYFGVRAPEPKPPSTSSNPIASPVSPATLMYSSYQP